MFSNFLLKDFVCSIPLCQPETDFGSIINIFQRLNCQQLAVFQGNGRWGIIDSKDLLLLMTAVWTNDRAVLVNHPRSTMHRQSISHLTDRNLNSIIKSAKVYQEDIKLDEFLKYLPEGLAGDEEYLLIDRSGELQGKLDKNKVLEHLALLAQNSLESYVPLKLDYMGNLLDSIALPVQLETAFGQQVYSNSYWQQLIEQQNDQYPSRSDNANAFYAWWIEQQRSPTLPQSLGDRTLTQSSNNEPKNSIDDCSTQLSSLNVNSLGQPNLNIAVEPQDETEGSTSASSHLQIKRINDWNYLKIPLINTSIANTAGNLAQCYLVLAFEVAKPDCGSKIAATKTVTNKLLATICHELKSPLTGIIGLSSLLTAHKLGELDRRQTRYLKLIHSSGQKMVGTINDLAGLIGPRDETSKLESIDLELLCRQTYQRVKSQLQPVAKTDSTSANFARLKLDLDSKSQTAVAERSRLSYILFHLMMETIEFAESEELLNIKIISYDRLTAIVVGNTVTDISQTNSSSTDNSSLHLAIAEYLAEAIEGSLTNTYSSTGCQFTLLLPKLQIEPASCNLATASTTKNEAKQLTILHLYPEPEVLDVRADNCYSKHHLQKWSDNSQLQADEQYRIIEADGLEQAHTLARIWQLDVIVLEGDRIANPLAYLRSLQKSPFLSALPLITLDKRTTEAANQIEGLNIYPCLLPTGHLSIEDLMQVIKIAVET